MRFALLLLFCSTVLLRAEEVSYSSFLMNHLSTHSRWYSVKKITNSLSNCCLSTSYHDRAWFWQSNPPPPSAVGIPKGEFDPVHSMFIILRWFRRFLPIRCKFLLISQLRMMIPPSNFELSFAILFVFEEESDFSLCHFRDIFIHAVSPTIQFTANGPFFSLVKTLADFRRK